MFPRFDSGDRQQRIDQSGAFKARTGRQILGRWREPPVDQNNEQKGPEGRQNKTICRPFRPGCDFLKKNFAFRGLTAPGRGSAGLPALNEEFF